MPNKNYLKGRRAEYKAMQILRDQGCIVFRTAGSHGTADVIGIGPTGRIVFVSVKTGGARPSAKERDALSELAMRCDKEYYNASVEVWTFPGPTVESY